MPTLDQDEWVSQAFGVDPSAYATPEQSVGDTAGSSAAANGAQPSPQVAPAQTSDTEHEQWAAQTVGGDPSPAPDGSGAGGSASSGEGQSGEGQSDNGQAGEVTPSEEQWVQSSLSVDPSTTAAVVNGGQSASGAIPADDTTADSGGPSSFLQSAENFGSSVVQDAENLGAGVEQTVQSTYDQAQQAAQPYVQSAENFGSSVVQDAQNLEAGAVQNVEDAYDAAKQTASNLAADAENAVASLPGDAANMAAVVKADLGGGAVWNAPFDLGSADNTADACRMLVDIKTRSQDWTSAGFDAEMQMLNGAIDRQLSALSGDRPLTQTEADTLTATGLMAVQTLQDALKNFVAAISAELDKYTGVEAQAALDTAAELLHQEFRKGEGSNKIADIKAMSEKAQEMVGNVKDYVGYAQKTKGVIKSAEKLEQVSKGLEAFKGKLETAGKLMDLASDVATIAGKVSEKPSETASDIGKFRATFALVDFAISKSNVPIIGQLWSDYIKPCAEMALNKLQALDDMVDNAERASLADDWWEQANKGMSAPSITDSGLNGLLLAKTFPGGQPMLDFMWSLFRGSPPTSAPKEVGQQFVKFRKQFNAGLPADEQLDTDAAWYNLWDVFGTEEATNLMAWVTSNKDYIWAMQYGALPHP